MNQNDNPIDQLGVEPVVDTPLISDDEVAALAPVTQDDSSDEVAVLAPEAPKETTEQKAEGEPDGGEDFEGNEETENEPEQPHPLAYVPVNDNSNVTLRYQVTSPMKDTPNNQKAAPVHLLGVSVNTYNDIVGRSPQFKDAGTVPWRKAVSIGVSNAMEYNTFTGAIEREGSQWRQQINNDDKDPLRLGTPPISGKADGRLLVGAEAIQHMARATRSGAVMQIPLIHSGFWITITVPQPSALFALEQVIQNEKYEIFRNIGSLLFNVQMAYVYRHVTKFLLEHIVETTLPSSVRIQDIPKYIRVTDLLGALQGIACTLYPNGYKYSTPCLASIGKCSTVITEVLNLTKMFFYDVSAITKEQAEFMSKRVGTRTLDEILKYQEDASFNNKREVEIAPEVKVKFRICSLEELIVASDATILELEEMVRTSLGDLIEPESVQQHMAGHLNVSNVRQYAHLIESVSIGKNWVEDRNTIKSFTQLWSTNNDIAEKFYTEIQKFIDACTVCVIAIPNYRCPVCHETVDTEFRHPHLIPQDPIKLFFTLVDRKLRRSQI